MILRGKITHHFLPNCKVAAMLPNDTLESPSVAETRDQRRQRLLTQLQAQAAPLLEQMADTLVDAPDRELFRSVEIQARDLGQQLAAATQQAAPG